MSCSKVVSRCFISAAAVIAEVKNTNSKNEELRRPSELPIYTPDKPAVAVPESTDAEEPNSVEEAVRAVRETVTKYAKEAEAYTRVAVESFEKSKENLDGLIKYLRQEDNTLPKAGAIGIGALTGLIFGLRGGFIKRTLYATTGATGMAAVCYPKEAAEYSQIGLSEGKRYLTIAYNFAYGVKKDDPPLELPSLPKIPTSVDEVWSSIKSSASSLISEEKPEKKE